LAFSAAGTTGDPALVASDKSRHLLDGARRPAAASSGAALFGLTVMTGVPVVTFACTMYPPANDRLGGDGPCARPRRRRRR
jgi:hypothetical protein